MDKISLIVLEDEEDITVGKAVMIIINDINLLTYHHVENFHDRSADNYCFYNHSGLHPSKVFFPSKRFLGEDESCNSEEGLTRILGCICGAEECDPVYVRITVKESTVVWSDFSPGEGKYPLKSFGPFEFDKKQYFAELEKRGEKSYNT